MTNDELYGLLVSVVVVFMTVWLLAILAKRDENDGEE